LIISLSIVNIESLNFGYISGALFRGFLRILKLKRRFNFKYFLDFEESSQRRKPYGNLISKGG
jgi:hypothetical protein